MKFHQLFQETPLTIAIANGETKIVDLLLKHPAIEINKITIYI